MVRHSEDWTVSLAVRMRTRPLLVQCAAVDICQYMHNNTTTHRAFRSDIVDQRPEMYTMIIIYLLVVNLLKRHSEIIIMRCAQYV